jgi:hypothetical protein
VEYFSLDLLTIEQMLLGEGECSLAPATTDNHKSFSSSPFRSVSASLLQWVMDVVRVVLTTRVTYSIEQSNFIGTFTGVSLFFCNIINVK